MTEKVKSAQELVFERLKAAIADTPKAEVRQKYFLEALEINLGIVTQTCRVTGVPKSTFYFWYRSNPEFKAGVKEVNEVVLDYAESSLYKLVQEGNIAAVIFTLKTKGKHRGYIESINIKHGVDRGANAEMDEIFESMTPLQRAKILGTPIPAVIDKDGNDNEREIESIESKFD